MHENEVHKKYEENKKGAEHNQNKMKNMKN